MNNFLKFLKQPENQNISLEELTEKLNKLHILVKEYDDRVLFIYGPGAERSPEAIASGCRSIILSKDLKNILCWPFDRFFNYGEIEGDNGFNRDSKGFTAMTKFDGSIISVYYDGSNWCTASKSKAFAEGNIDGHGGTYHSLFLRVGGFRSEDHFQLACDHDLFAGYTYIFEVMAPENFVVTRYEDEQIALLAYRDNTTGKLVNTEGWLSVTLSLMCTGTGCFNRDRFILPEYLHFTDIKDLLDHMYKEDKSNYPEGYVCVDSKGVMLKVKHSEYVRVAYLKGQVGCKPNFELILSGDAPEYLTYFPEDTEEVQKVANQLESIFNLVENVYSTIWMNLQNSIGEFTQKDFAAKCFERFDPSTTVYQVHPVIRHMVLKLRQVDMEIDEDISEVVEKVIVSQLMGTSKTKRTELLTSIVEEVIPYYEMITKGNC